MLSENKKTSPERVYAFSDGVFAIIITIMVLELKKPEGPTFHALFLLWPTWISYAASYLFIAIVWVNHHYLLKHTSEATSRLMWANFAHLFSVSLIPFLTVWIAETELAPVPVAMYAFVFFLVNITYLALAYENRKQHARSFLTLSVFLLAMILAFWLPLVGFTLICGCLLLYLRPEMKSIKTKTIMKNKIAIVTGASAGIGAATAIRLGKDFSGIVLVARREEELQVTAGRVKEAGAEPLIIAADLRQIESVDQIIAKTIEKFGQIDAVINIAGAVPQIHLFEMTDEQWNDGAEMKLHGARRLTIKAWPYLKASKGSVVLTSGNSAEDPKPGFAAVATINAAIVALAKAFAEQGILDGVQVNSVLPGPVMSNRRIGFLKKWSAANNMSMEEAKAKFLEEAHIERYGEPEEIAELMAFLVSPAAKWMTGTAVRMDGGEVKSI
jgi:3-oxoacyl-[acyl-carrier protein] reductase